MKDYFVCSRTEVAKYQSRHECTAVLSLLDRGKRPFLHPNRKVKWKLMWFDDANLPTDVDAPTPFHVSEILRWGRETVTPDDVLLVHCEAGQCRSTAAALILDVQKNGVDKFDECWKRLLEKRDIALPNPLIVLYGDQLLGMGGRMFEHSENYCKQELARRWGYDNLFERPTNE